MATKRDLAIRLLRKLEVVGAGQVASDADVEIAEEKLNGVHAFLLANDKLHWTWADLPIFAEEPYAMMGAYLAAPEFGKQPDPALWLGGLAFLNRSNAAPASEAPASGEYF